MINLNRIEQSLMKTQPYEWAFINDLFETQDAEALVTSYPRDKFKTVKGYDNEKGYQYEARALIGMGANVPSHIETLSPAWCQLAYDLVSDEYRAAMTRLVGLDLMSLPIEVNVFHYGPSAWLGPHVDLKDKIVTHILYFNDFWNKEDGGCLLILNSSNMVDEAACVEPVIGNSAVLKRSEKSWHAVTPVAKDCCRSRRSMTVTFYSPHSISTMWPPGDKTPLHNYYETNNHETEKNAIGSLVWLRNKVSAWKSSLSE